MSGPVAQGIAAGVARVIAWRDSEAAGHERRHMRRVLASECPDGVEPDPALVRRWSRRAFGRTRATGPTARAFPGRARRRRARFRLEDGAEHLRAALALGRGIVMALPHVGSWEWGGAWLALEGMPHDGGRRTARARRSSSSGSWPTGRHGAHRRAAGRGFERGAAARRSRTASVAGLVSDRDLVGNGVEVEFFGERTTLPGGAATLALRTGAPLVPVVVYSGPGDWHTGVVHPPLDTEPAGHARERRRPGDPGARHHLRARHTPPSRAVAPLPAELAETTLDEDRHGVAVRADSTRRRAGPGPRPLASLHSAGLGHESSDRAGPADPALAGPSSEVVERDVVVIGRPTGVRSNGSVAPVALSPDGSGARRARRARGRFRRGPRARATGPRHRATAWSLARRSPMVGTYHRAGVSRWVPVLQPLAAPGRAAPAGARRRVRGRPGDGRALGRRDLRSALQRCRPGALRVGRARCATPRAGPTVFFVGRHEERKGLASCSRPSPRRPTAVLWVAGDGPADEMQRRRHPESDRVRLARRARRRRGGPPPGRGRRPLRAVARRASRSAWSLLEGMAAGCAVVASDIEGYREAAGGLAALVPPGDVDALARALGRPSPTPSGEAGPRASRRTRRPGARPRLVDGRTGPAIPGRLSTGHRRRKRRER